MTMKNIPSSPKSNILNKKTPHYCAKLLELVNIKCQKDDPHICSAWIKMYKETCSNNQFCFEKVNTIRSS